jgi:hypothetical protein
VARQSTRSDTQTLHIVARPGRLHLSTAQQARPKVFHIMEPVRAQWTIASTVVMKPRSSSSGLTSASGQGSKLRSSPARNDTVPAQLRQRSQVPTASTHNCATILATGSAQPLGMNTAGDASLTVAVFRTVAVVVAAFVDHQGATLHVR